MEDLQTSHPVELLTFELGEHEYALDIMCVREIRGWAKATPLPHAPSFMRGVINLRGAVLPVMDLGERLGLPTRPHCDRNVIIVVSFEETMTGLLVDAVSDIIALPPDALQPPPDAANYGAQTVVKALTLIEDRMIRVLDLNNIVVLSQGEAA
ncbi:chemotaxis protein CheW [uncultured Tateyamaria sp.]|uniref:chemotaxis protein CheW n=1 Tax=uncultured Tateyamaria sp. TaxID=455651 RepID=UPI00262377DB|nr:chemotaxis protein CheW [uncultured Tateyamaria sp.]